MSNMSQEEIDRLLNGGMGSPAQEDTGEENSNVQEAAGDRTPGDAPGPGPSGPEGPDDKGIQEQAPHNPAQGMGEIRSMKAREQQKPRMEEKKARSKRHGKKPGAPRGKMAQANIGMIIDMPLQVTVELGKVHLSIKEILAFTIGSIIELDRSADDLVDVKVNGKLIARGEIVAVDENYGVRVTDIVSPERRAKG